MPTTPPIEIKIKKDGEIKKVADREVKVGNAVRWKAPEDYRLHVLFSGASPSGTPHVSAAAGAVSEELRPGRAAEGKDYPYIVLLYHKRNGEWKMYPSDVFSKKPPFIPPPRITVPAGTKATG